MLKQRILDKLEVNKDELKHLTVPIVRKSDQGTYQIISNNLYQMDLMEMPAFNKFKYILCIVNMRTRISDVVPLRSKTQEHVLKAFMEIRQRNIVKNEILGIFADNGSEFKNKLFVNYCETEGIRIRFTRRGNHKQNAIVENMNGFYKRFLNMYLSVISNRLQKYYLNWPSVLYKVRDELNVHFSKTYPKKIEFDVFDKDKDVPPKKPKYEIGQMVYHALDQPEYFFQKKVLHGTFRHGDRAFSLEKYEIDNIERSGKNWRYHLKGIYGSFLENQLLI